MLTLETVLIQALVSAFLVLLITKTGLRYSARDRADKVGLHLIADALDCDFCTSWWTNFALAWTVVCISGDLSYLPLSVPATPITRYLI